MQAAAGRLVSSLHASQHDILGRVDSRTGVSDPCRELRRNLPDFEIPSQVLLQRLSVASGVLSAIHALTVSLLPDVRDLFDLLNVIRHLLILEQIVDDLPISLLGLLSLFCAILAVLLSNLPHDLVEQVLILLNLNLLTGRTRLPGRDGLRHEGILDLDMPRRSRLHLVPRSDQAEQGPEAVRVELVDQLRTLLVCVVAVLEGLRKFDVDSRISRSP